MKILIVEDDLRVSDLIKRGLEERGYACEVAYDGMVAQKLLVQASFDLVIMDIILPKINGIDLCKEVRQLYPALPVILLTALGTTDDKVEGFDAGADDYLVKPFEMRELAVRVRALLKRQGQGLPLPDVLRYADLEMNLQTKVLVRHSKEINLTPKEFKLLAYFMKHPERVISRSEIAEEVWDTHFDTGTNFIDVYINYLRKKIDKDFDSKLIHTKSGMGFILMQGYGQSE
ncbi:two-component system response regulator [Lunatimonas lonarensis]|uniref:Two-component system response regulator n=1 Tax=Lunatimonas lonarensis TaxID=1232681 RepID=R7ZNV6_9BACT|nr:response regulator transcription factor [Lunatimonas lonarensis]EON75790.1 two-component system response regulator [Lunatimonas lonarensis]